MLERGALEPSQSPPMQVVGKVIGFQAINSGQALILGSDALERFKHRIRKVIPRAKGVSLETTIAELAPYIRVGVAISASAKRPLCWIT